MRLLCAVLAAILFPLAFTCPAGAQPVGWVANGWNAYQLSLLDPSVAAHFYGVPSSFETSPDPAAPTGIGGGTPVADYASYAQFAADTAAGTISRAFGWVMYDPEDWPQTPADEQQHVGKYLKLFGQLAHSYGYKVIEAPARDLANTDLSCPAESGETLDDWYIRCGIAGEAAVNSDAVIVQTQADTVNLSQYDWMFSNAGDQITRNNPDCAEYAEVSTNYGTPAQMAAAAQSVTAAGFYVSMTQATTGGADQFFQIMQAAGY